MKLKYKSWRDISLATWKELSSIDSDNKWTIQIERLSILTDSDPEELRKMTPAEFNLLINESEFLNEKLDNKIELRFKIDGVEYGMIPHLDLISLGEFIDAEEFSKNPTDSIHLLAALLWRPVINDLGDDWMIAQHKTEGFNKRANLFLEKLPITHIWGGLLFFSSSAILSTEIIADYLIATQNELKETKKTQKHSKKRVQKNGERSGSGMTS